MYNITLYSSVLQLHSCGVHGFMHAEPCIHGYNWPMVAIWQLYPRVTAIYHGHSVHKGQTVVFSIYYTTGGARAFDLSASYSTNNM